MSNASPSSWHLHVHALPSDRPRFQQSILGRETETVRLEAADQAIELSVSFSGFISSVEALPESFVEWDGSFLWRPPEAEVPTRIEGNAYDGAENMQNVELKVEGDVRAIAELLRCCGWPENPLVIQCVSLGVYVLPETLLTWE